MPKTGGIPCEPALRSEKEARVARRNPQPTSEPALRSDKNERRLEVALDIGSFVYMVTMASRAGAAARSHSVVVSAPAYICCERYEFLGYS